jgi:hypothetical protein
MRRLTASLIGLTGAGALAIALGASAAGAATAGRPFPKLARHVTNTTTTGPDSLNDMNCPSTTACFALGGPTDSNYLGYPYDTFIEDWNGKTWTAFIPPTAVLSSISCLSAKSCFAVGTTTPSTGWDVVDGFNLVYHWNGTTWTKQSMPSVPSSGGQRPDANGFSSITCSTTSCMAVGLTEYPGSFTPESAFTLTLAEQWSGAKWTVLTTVNPPVDDGLGIDELNSVKCASATSCIAVGDAGSDADGNPPSALAEQWNGKTWKALTTVNP